MARVNPLLSVFLAGKEYKCDPEGMDDNPILVDALRVDWGRDEYMSHSEPATSSIVLYERTGVIAEMVSNRALIGQFVAFYATTGPYQWCFYNGRITGCKVKRVRMGTSHRAAGYEWLVTIESVSREAALGNIVYPKDATNWARGENMQTRAVRIRDTQSPVSGINEFFFFPGHVTSLTKELEVADQDLRSITDEFFMSMGDTYSYLPDQNVIRFRHRRAGTFSNNLAAQVRMTSDNDLVHISATDVIEDGGNGWTYPGAVLPACEVEMDETLDLKPGVSYNRVEVSAEPSEGIETTDFLPDPPMDSLGRRTLKLDTWLINALLVDEVTAEVWARVQNEGSPPRYPEITWDTRRFGGFTNERTARNLIMCGEHSGRVYLEGSPYTEFMINRGTESLPGHVGLPWQPLFAVIGGSVTYEDGGWVVGCRLQQYQNKGSGGYPTWDTLSSLMKWGDTSNVPGNALAYAKSVSWNDMRWFADPGSVYALP